MKTEKYKKLNMEKYCILPDTNLIDCMRVIDRTASGIAIVVDSAGKLIGTVSDGDIRRALINGACLDGPVNEYINRTCVAVSPSDSQAKVLDIMQTNRFDQVPIIDAKGRFVGLHLLYNILGKIERPNWAVIMAGGKGIRLRPLTEKIPKPMIRVAGRPIIERLILQFIAHGIKHIYLAVNYLSHIIEEYFQDGHRFGCKIEYLREDDPLGSGGALSLLPKAPEQPLILANGDLILDVDLSNMIDFHVQNEFYATIGVHPYCHQVPYGCIEIKGDQIIRIKEKPLIHKTINAGLYVLSPEAVSSIPQDTFFHITHLFDVALEKSFRCGAYTIDKEWIDIGQPQELKKASGQI